MTNCRESQWTCNNGDCISIEDRCDLTDHCSDSSDELDCTKFILPLGYNKMKYPPVEKGASFNVGLFLNITGVKEVRLSSFAITIDVVQDTYWKDSRLAYRILNQDLNKVESYEELWVPRFYIEDGSESAAEMTSKVDTLWIAKESKPKLQSDEVTHEGKSFFSCKKRRSSALKINFSKK